MDQNRIPALQEEQLSSLRHVRAARSGYHYLEELAFHMFGLTARERQLGHLLLQGFVYRQIAQQLFRSESTVKSDARHIFAKTQVKDRRAFVQHINALIESI